jgi:hypothetical protein
MHNCALGKCLRCRKFCGTIEDKGWNTKLQGHLAHGNPIAKADGKEGGRPGLPPARFEPQTTVYIPAHLNDALRRGSNGDHLCTLNARPH